VNCTSVLPMKILQTSDYLLHCKCSKWKAAKMHCFQCHIFASSCFSCLTMWKPLNAVVHWFFKNQETTSKFYVPWRKLHTLNPQCWDDMSLTGTFCWVHVSWYTLLCCWGGDPAVIVLEVLGATVQDLCSHILFREMCCWVVWLHFVNVTPLLVRLGPQ